PPPQGRIPPANEERRGGTERKVVPLSLFARYGHREEDRGQPDEEQAHPPERVRVGFAKRSPDREREQHAPRQEDGDAETDRLGDGSPAPSVTTEIREELVAEHEAVDDAVAPGGGRGPDPPGQGEPGEREPARKQHQPAQPGAAGS